MAVARLPERNRLEDVSIQKRKLGRGGPLVMPIGLGCFSFSGGYGEAEDEESAATIRHAVELGCNFLDTADLYGGGHNERLVGRAIGGCRDQIVLATKFGYVWDETGHAIARDGRPERVRSACEASLRWLGTDWIDLYYLHRVDPKVPIEETIGAMAQLVAEGKVHHLGISEASPEQIRRAHATHPVAALQSEYSLWTREPEREILALCRELGIGFVAFAPLGRGFFSGQMAASKFSAGDMRGNLPRFKAANLELNREALRNFEEFAREKGHRPSQVALAWVLARGEHVTAIPGTRRPAHVEENLAAAAIKLSAEDLRKLEEVLPAESFHGERYPEDSVFRPAD